jgi:glycosyltransferase involved in cell wall biosynthesis
LQCNGTPTYRAYRSLSPSPLLFFDTRLRASAVIARDELEARLARLMAGGPLRLAFSGRLIAMKGADHLIEVARELRSLGVDYRLTIWGDGDLVPEMESRISRYGLRDRVELAGVRDFERELVGLMRRGVDLFVCCHRQGDPSCTYLETLAAGVPIAGYANEALDGLLQCDAMGRSVNGPRPRALALLIRELDRERAAVAQQSRRAREFAAGHTFELTMGRRVDHLGSIARAPRGPTRQP